jgi:copper(I)-binding protein
LAAAVEIESGQADGKNTIDLPAGSKVRLQPKGPHIALKGVNEELTGYEMFPLWLTFERAGKVKVEVMVEENDEAMTGHERVHGDSSTRDGDPK